MKLKQPKTLNQVRKELGKLYWLLCRNPGALPFVHGGTRALGRMIDVAAIALLNARLTGKPLPEHQRRFIEGK